jgi:hypothetical protein
MGWRTFFSAGKKFRATNKVARLLAAATPTSFGHCGDSGRKRSFTASVSKRARNWALSQCKRQGAGKLELRFRRTLSLHKCWPPHSHSDISPQHEQKHLLHNRSNCRHRDRAQIAWPVLGVGPAGAIATARSLRCRRVSRRSAFHCQCQRKAHSFSNSKSVVAHACRLRISAAGHINLRLCRPSHPKYLCSESKILRRAPFMPDYPEPEKEKSSPSSEDIQVPPIPKQTAGAVTGAAIGSIAGPTGAVVGGVIGAFVGKAAADGRPVRKAVKRAAAVSKSTQQRHPPKKSLPKSRKAGGRRSRAKTAKRTRSRRSPAARSRKRTVRASRKLIKSRQRSKLSRARQKHRSSRTKRR